MIPALALKTLTLTHGRRVLIDQADLTLGQGTLTLLAGANGQGKTTLLRALMGLHPLQGGAIEIFGQTPRRARRRTGYMPQDRRLPAPQMTGRAFLAASWQGTRFGLPGWGQNLRSALQACLAMTGSEKLVDQPLSQLSGGERQRVFLAGALLDAPSLLVLDEPLSGMDTQWQAAILAMLRARCRETGMAVLMSCHGIEAALSYADHVLLIDSQKLELRDAAL
ncbi:ATP-binding cassette domain-containing protein [Asaia sp. VD9]|uniref:metal ABC transporter ATP-binding protein n=1 Tax=Asaia sp. VD9 TaxID=3081235 RepID=UPI003015EE88